MSIQRTAPTQEQIADRAYALWEKEGYPKGREQFHWQEAERQLRTEHTPATAPAATLRATKPAAPAPSKSRFRAPKNPVLS